MTAGVVLLCSGAVAILWSLRAHREAEGRSCYLHLGRWGDHPGPSLEALSLAKPNRRGYRRDARCNRLHPQKETGAERSVYKKGERVASMRTQKRARGKDTTNGHATKRTGAAPPYAKKRPPEEPR